MKKLYTILFALFILLSNAQNIPIADANLKALLVNNPAINTSGDSEIQVAEAQAVTNLDIYDGHVSSLNGLQYFTNLETLDCSANDFVTFDELYNLPNLKTLYVTENTAFTNINFSGLVNLESLYIGGTQLLTVNFGGLTNLKNLIIFRCFLPYLDISTLNTVDNFRNEEGKIDNLNFGTVPLKKLHLDNYGPVLDVSAINSLENLECVAAPLVELETLILGNQPNLTSVLCGASYLSALDFSGTPNITTFGCGSCRFQTINISNLTHLQSFGLTNNLLTSLDISGLNELTFVEASNNLLTTFITDPANSNLTSLYLNENKLTAFSLNNVPNLNYLSLTYNLLTSFDLRNITIPPTTIYISDNLLTELYMKNNIVDPNISFIRNPTMQYICADTNELQAVQDLVTYYGYTNCIVNDSCTLTTNNNALNANLALYPNPNKGAFFIKGLEKSATTTIIVIDAQGRNVFKNEIRTTSENLNITIPNGLEKGLYFVQILQNNDSTQILKMMVE